MGYELVGVEFHARPDNALLRVYLDSEHGISLEDCQRVSHQFVGASRRRTGRELSQLRVHGASAVEPSLERHPFGATSSSRTRIPAAHHDWRNFTVPRRAAGPLRAG